MITEEGNNEKEVDTSQEQDNSKSAEEITETSAEDKYNELNDKYLRLYSEFDNYRKRTSKERVELFKTAGEDIIKDLLPILDDFNRAVNAIDEKSDIKALKDGIQLVHSKFQKTLQGKGLKALDAIGTTFDPEIHEAITKIPAPKKKLKGKIVDEIEKGYALNDKVIRFAKVVIGE